MCPEQQRNELNTVPVLERWPLQLKELTAHVEDPVSVPSTHAISQLFITLVPMGSSVPF